MRWVMEALMELPDHPVPSALIFIAAVIAMVAFTFVTI